MSDYFSKVKKSESAGKANAKNKNSSASGLYQFTKGTWEGLGYNWNDRFNTALQEEAMRKYTDISKNRLKKELGKEPTDADLYGAHFLGAGTYIKALKAGDKALLSNVVSSSAYNANKSVMSSNGKSKTVGDLKRWLESEMGAEATTTSYVNNTPQEERTVIQPIDLNSPEYSGTVFSEQTEEEPQQQKEPTVEQTAQELLDESFLEEFQAQQLQEQIPQQQVQDYPQYNIEVKPIEYQPIQMQNGGSIPISSNGLWEYPNQQVIVPTSGNITMKNVDYPTFGKSIETGEIIVMQPNKNYFFNNTKNVLETPLFKYEEE